MLRRLLPGLVVLALLTAGCTGLPIGPGPIGEGGPGARAADYLRPRPYASIVVELDFVAGAEPDGNAVALLEQRLEQATQKPVDVVRTGGVQGRGSGHKYSLDEIADLEGQHRQHRTGGDRAAIYVLWLDGGFQGDNSEAKTLGVAYKGSAVAMFKANLRAASQATLTNPLPPSIRQVEESVAVHEMGHILGLVNLGTPMVRDHEDKDHPHHSRNDQSVMYWAVERGDLIGALLGQNPPDDFDSDDKADLQAMRQG